jgi:predicted metal-dependent hydrolase
MSDYQIRIVYSRRKSLSARAISAHFLELRAPMGMSEEEILSVLRRKQRKVQAMLTQAEKNQQGLVYEEGTRIPLFGQEIALSYSKHQESALNYDENNGILIISEQLKGNESKILKAFYDGFVPNLLALCSELCLDTGFRPNRVSTRWNKSRWGSCSTIGNISLNRALVMAPVPVIRYVIIHELTHLQHPNHSPQFWKALATLMPDYRQHYNWLKENGHTLRIKAPVPSVSR